MPGIPRLLFLACWLLAGFSQLAADEPSPERGYRWLTEKVYLSPDFDQQTFEQTWTKWPEPLKSQAEKATPDERRQLAFARYGLTPRPADPSKPLQYVVGADGVWTMNCFACHAGKVAGKVIPGLPNSHYALMTLTEETRSVKAELKKPFGRLDLGSMVMPLGSTNGTTNAVNFGVALLSLRDKDLNFISTARPPAMLHHDMDPPPWWHFHRKKQIYADGFTEKSVRGLMQFMLIRSNGPDNFREWEADFRDVFAYLESLRPPKYPYAIDPTLAAAGEKAFVRVCAECHGNYREEPYPERVIPLAEIGTDRVRLDSLSKEHRAAFGQSWFTHYGERKTIADPAGYVAPPLDGIWATAPYLHNGSVPTLWHLLHPAERPKIWRRTENGYDQEKVGLEVNTFDKLPAELSSSERRTYFDTAPRGKGAAGHLFPDQLSDEERRAVLEYLKTL